MLERSVKSTQTQARIMSFVLTTTGTPAVSGSDKNQVLQVVDNGAGDVTVILKKPFALVPEVHLTNLGSTQQKAQVEAVDVDRFTVNIYSVGVPSTDTDSVPADGVVSVFIFGKDDNKYR